MPKKYLFPLLLTLLFPALSLLAQNGAGLSSPIWGNNTSAAYSIGAPLYDARNWGVAPSQQTLNEWRETNRQQTMSNEARRRYRDGNGQLILTDANGNIVYDNTGNPTIDSAGLGQSSGSINADADGIPPPPDDPVDVPIDGGVGILLAIGLVNGYNLSKRKSKLTTKKLAQE